MYNDMYASFFASEEIKGMKILLTNGANLTFLPTINSDLWIPAESALMK